jgi:hypothetical protein
MDTTMPTLEQRVMATLAENTVVPVNSAEVGTLIAELMSRLYPTNQPRLLGDRADQLRTLLIRLQHRHAELVEHETEIAWRRHA